MEDYDGREEPNCSEGPPASIKQRRVSQKIKSFQRDLGTGTSSSSSSGRASPPPPPPPPLPDTTQNNNNYNHNHNHNHNTGGSSETGDGEQQKQQQQQQQQPINKFKSWNQWEQKNLSMSSRSVGGERGGRPVVARSPTARRPSVETPHRMVVPRSPTASVCSTESSYSAAHQFRQTNVPAAKNTNTNTNTNIPSYGGGRSSWGGGTTQAQPEMQRSFSTGKFGSPQPRHHSTTGGGRRSLEPQGSLYKNMLKPVQPKETPENAARSHEKEAYGAIIETPKKSSVSSLHAMFDSQNAVPLMPMTSTNARVRHSLPPGSSVKSPSVKAGSGSGSGSVSSAGQRFRTSTGGASVSGSGSGWNNGQPPSEAVPAHRRQSSPSKLEQKLQQQQHRSKDSFRVPSSSREDSSVSSAHSYSSAHGGSSRSVVSSWSQKKQAGAEKEKEQESSLSSSRPRSIVVKPNKSVVASWNQKHQEQKEQQESSSSRPRNVVVQPRSLVENKESDNYSRLAQHYSASWRVTNTVERNDNSNVEDDDASKGERQKSSKTSEHGDDDDDDDDINRESSSVISSWQQRCKPRPLDMEVPDSPIRSNAPQASETEARPSQKRVVETKDVSSSLLASMMYSQNKKPIGDKPKEVPPPNDISSASLASMMYSQSKKLNEDKPKEVESKNDLSSASVAAMMYPQPKHIEPNDVPSSTIASMMYSQKKPDEVKQDISESAVDWPSDGNEREGEQQEPAEGSEVDETATDIIQNMIIDDMDVDETATDFVQTILIDDFVEDEKASPVEEHSVEAENTTTTESKQLSQECLEENDTSRVEPLHNSPRLSDNNKTVQSSTPKKPWESDTKHSVVQSWQTRSSKLKGSSSLSDPIVQSNEQDGSSKKGIEKMAGEVKGDEASVEEPFPSDVYSDLIEEKKSGDLSIDEDKILGEESGGLPTYDVPNDHTHPKNIPFYDDDSYISRGDTASRALGASESFKSASARSRTSLTFNSEEISVYVEDERIITRKEDKILSAQFEQMNLEVAVGGGDLDSKTGEEKGGLTKPALSINTTPRAGTTGLPRLNPSPRDNDQYRIRYFEDTGASTPKSLRRNQEEKKTDHDVVSTIQTKKSTENQVIDIWATNSASNDERDEAINFDQTDEWLNRDPDIEGSLPADDASVASDTDNINPVSEKGTPKSKSEPRPVIIKKPPQSLRTLEKEKQRTKASSIITRKAKAQAKQEVFDPFGIDAEEAEGLTVEISDDLFSQNPDPFTSEDSFSPLEWSNANNGKKSFVDSTPQPQPQIGYYNSPDSKYEI
eukprot:jgi/Psemu1/283939/fgenesh1_pg.38_\